MAGGEVGYIVNSILRFIIKANTKVDLAVSCLNIQELAERWGVHTSPVTLFLTRDKS